VEIRDCDFADMKIGDWRNFLRFLSACWTDDDPCPSARGIEKLVVSKHGKTIWYSKKYQITKMIRKNSSIL
jgi:hypothetical protein